MFVRILVQALFSSSAWNRCEEWDIFCVRLVSGFLGGVELVRESLCRDVHRFQSDLVGIDMRVSLLSGGKDPHYVLGLVSGLIRIGIFVDLIGSEEMGNYGITKSRLVNFRNLHGSGTQRAGIAKKALRALIVYLRLISYAGRSKSRIFHIQWENKFAYFDWTVLNAFYKLLGKKLVFTAHNVNAGERDGRNTLVNKLALRVLYRIVDHIIVHTEKMKEELIGRYYVQHEKVSVIPYGINNVVPMSELGSEQAKKMLNMDSNQKALLFLGNIASYKGLEYLILALGNLLKKDSSVRLMIAGRVRKGDEAYWKGIQRIIKKLGLKDYIIERIEDIPDVEIERYCKAADVMVLPYRFIFQSGILFLAYAFGLPVIATDVGSLKADIVEGKTGFVCRAMDSQDLAEKIAMFFNSDLYRKLKQNRPEILTYANEKYSWERIGEKTEDVYEKYIWVAKN